MIQKIYLSVSDSELWLVGWLVLCFMRTKKNYMKYNANPLHNKLCVSLSNVQYEYL